MRREGGMEGIVVSERQRGPLRVVGNLVVPARLENLERVLRFIHTGLSQGSCSMTKQLQLDIAVEELFVNVCRYAYRDQDVVGACEIDYVVDGSNNVVTVQLTDQGTPFNPLTRRDPTKPASIQEAKVGGLGILMAKRSTDELSYRRDGDSNVVTMKKNCWD